jgi:hypothetical protein
LEQNRLKLVPRADVDANARAWSSSTPRERSDRRGMGFAPESQVRI